MKYYFALEITAALLIMTGDCLKGENKCIHASVTCFALLYSDVCSRKKKQTKKNLRKANNIFGLTACGVNNAEFPDIDTLQIIVHLY